MARSMSTGCRGPPRRRAAPPLLLLLASLLLAGARQASGEVAMVWLVTRHGARNVLPKSSLLQETDAAGGPTLLPKGVNASVNAGAPPRRRAAAGPCSLPSCAAVYRGSAPGPAARRAPRATTTAPQSLPHAHPRPAPRAPRALHPQAPRSARATSTTPPASAR